MKRIPGFPGYFATKDGKIYSEKYRSIRQLKAWKTQYGYLVVNLMCGKNKTNKFVHVLVLETFSKKRPHGLIARHYDDNKLNNNISNLIWGTKNENSKDMVRNKTSTYGLRNGRVKLNELQVRIIRRCKVVSTLFLAKLFHVDAKTCWRIKNRKLWNCIA